MRKYDIDPELKLLRNFHSPINDLILESASSILKIIPKGFDKRKVVIDTIQTNEFRIHIVTPKELVNEITPVLFYIHGGGFMFKAYPFHYKSEEEYATRCKIRVVGIDYDLAFKNPFPKAINECYDAYNYIINNSNKLKINPNKIIIGGDSAGGSLANDTYLKIRSNNIISPFGLMLLYPVVDNGSDTKSMERFIDTPCWDARCNKKMWEYYLQGKEYQSPLKRIDEFDIKNMYIELCEFDCLHDEGYELYNLLKDKVNNIILNDTKRTFHGYDVNRKAKVVNDSFEKRFNYINEIIK